MPTRFDLFAWIKTDHKVKDAPIVMYALRRIFSLGLICLLLIASSDAAINMYGRSGRSIVAAQSVGSVSPGAYQTPDSGLGGWAVSSPSNTGHGSTQVSASKGGNRNGAEANTASCLWHSFSDVPGLKTRVTLKFDWTLRAGVNVFAEDSNSSGTARYSFGISYSLDNGSTWTTKVGKSDSFTISRGPGGDGRSIDTSGSESVDLPNPGAIDITQIRVRDSIFASASVGGNGLGWAEADAGATASVSNIRLEVETPNCVANVLGDRWKGEYYNNTNLSGSPALVRDDGTGFLNLNFGGASPSSTCGLGADNFSARWTRTVNFTEAGVYRFIATVDNGVRLYVDGHLKIDQWGNLPLNTYTADVDLSAGPHEVKLEFVDYGGAASASLSWTNCRANVPVNRWKGEYFNNTDLAGSPAMVRDDGDGLLDFNLNFGSGSPSSACGVISDNFSVRWTRRVTFFANGVFRFSATVDNGVRLYVDGQLKIDKWADLPPNTYTADVALTEGDHEVKLEFVEYAGDASVNLSWTFVGSADCIDVVPANRWKGEYFNNSDFTGNPGLVRDHGDGFLDYQLNQCPPCGPNPACGLGGSFFSARYTRTINFARGVYRFFLSADSAARLFVDGQLKVDNPFSATGEVDVALSPGAHEIKVEYVANGFPHEASLSWDTICSVNAPAGRWRGEYYNNTNLTGSPAMALDEGDGFLNLNFGNDSPGAACGLAADNFSARWTRTVNFATGPYRFTLTVDDGARLYVDGELIIDKWFIQPSATYMAERTLTAGDHEIKLEYFDGGGAGMAILSWAAAAGFSCLPDVPLIGNAPRTGGGENIATTSIRKAAKRCGQKNSE